MLIIFENLNARDVILIKMHAAWPVCFQEKVSPAGRWWPVVPIFLPHSEVSPIITQSDLYRAHIGVHKHGDESVLL